MNARSDPFYVPPFMHGKAGIDNAALALFDLVHGGLGKTPSPHVVVNAPPGNAAQRCK